MTVSQGRIKPAFFLYEVKGDDGIPASCNKMSCIIVSALVSRVAFKEYGADMFASGQRHDMTNTILKKNTEYEH